MQQQKHILSCDWGTSSFRLRLVDIATRQCVAKTESQDGNAALFNLWKTNPSSDRVAFYLQHLKKSIDQLSIPHDLAIEDVPVLISGMASSSVGMKELPYAGLPFMLDGSSAYAEWIDGAPVLSNPILLISGAHQPDNVMRGEEIQLTGLVTLLDLPANEEFLFILPGTHSKHILVTGYRIERFTTYMTGEIFDIIAKHSILSHAVSDPKWTSNAEEDKQAFYDGVRKAGTGGLLSNLFAVRINQLKKILSPEQNYFFLSGLLIGSEIKHLAKHRSQKLVLCSTGNLLRLYEWALDCLSLLNEAIVVPAETLDDAALVGQLKVFSKMAIQKI